MMKSPRELIAALVLSFIVLGSACLAAEESSGAVLKIGTPNVVKSASIHGDSNMGVFSHLSNPTLMKMAADGSIEGLAAKSCQVSEDGKTWRFIIRDDLYWSDGKRLTPEDVQFTFNYLKERYPAAGWMKEVVGDITLEGDDQVVFKLTKPYSRLSLEFATYPLLAKHIWQEVEDPMEYINEGEIVGCGPYYISKTDLGAGIIYFQKNPYWNGTEPYFDSIEIHTYSNMDVLSLALEKGEVDAYYKYAGTYPYTSLKKLKDTGNFDFVEKDNIGLIFLGLNLKREPMSDISFRQALSYALNYSEMLKLDALGYGKVPNAGFVPPSMDGFKETRKLEYDPSRARAILEDAGYKDSNGNGIIEGKDGQEMKLTLLTRTDYQRMTELVVDYLRDLGIESEIKNVDSSTWIKQKDEGNYDMTVTRSTPWGMLMHASWGSGYFDSRRTGEGVLHVLDDPKFQELCDDILAATDEDQRKSLAHELQDYYAENLPGIPLYWNLVVTPYNKEFTGWISDPLYGIFNVDNFLSVRRSG